MDTDKEMLGVSHVQLGISSRTQRRSVRYKMLRGGKREETGMRYHWPSNTVCSEEPFHQGSCGPSLAYSRKRPVSGGLAFDWLLSPWKVLPNNRDWVCLQPGATLSLFDQIVYGDNVAYSKCLFLISQRPLAPLSQWFDLYRAGD